MWLTNGFLYPQIVIAHTIISIIIVIILIIFIIHHQHPLSYHHHHHHHLYIKKKWAWTCLACQWQTNPSISIISFFTVTAISAVYAIWWHCPNWHWHHWLTILLVMIVVPKITTRLALTNGYTDDMSCTLQPATAPFGVIHIAREAANPDHWTVH